MCPCPGVKSRSRSRSQCFTTQRERDSMPEVADWLRELPCAARFIFQGGPAARAAAGRAFGVALPETACRASATGERSALWLGPEEHLLLAPAENVSRIPAELS